MIYNRLICIAPFHDIVRLSAILKLIIQKIIIHNKLNISVGYKKQQGQVVTLFYCIGTQEKANHSCNRTSDWKPYSYSLYNRYSLLPSELLYAVFVVLQYMVWKYN